MPKPVFVTTQWTTPRDWKLGVLGGMGPAATAAFFNTLVHNTTACCDQDHVPVILDSDPAIPDRSTAIAAGRTEALYAALHLSLQRLLCAGATLIAIPCNTAHVLHARLQAVCPCEILHIVEITRHAFCERGLEQPALLASRGTIESGIYEHWFGAGALLNPAGLELDLVGQAIEQVKAGRLQEAAPLLRDAVALLARRGAGSVVIGCTDLSLLLPQVDLALPVVDSTAALAAEVQRRYLAARDAAGRGAAGLVDRRAADAS